MTKFNMRYVLFYIEVSIERGNDIRNKLFGSPRLLTRKPNPEVYVLSSDYHVSKV